MGTKEVLVRTRNLGWGTDTDLYETGADFAARFPSRAVTRGPKGAASERGEVPALRVGRGAGRSAWAERSFPKYV